MFGNIEKLTDCHVDDSRGFLKMKFIFKRFCGPR